MSLEWQREAVAIVHICNRNLITSSTPLITLNCIYYSVDCYRVLSLLQQRKLWLLVGRRKPALFPPPRRKRDAGSREQCGNTKSTFAHFSAHQMTLLMSQVVEQEKLSGSLGSLAVSCDEEIDTPNLPGGDTGVVEFQEGRSIYSHVLIRVPLIEITIQGHLRGKHEDNRNSGCRRRWRTRTPKNNQITKFPLDSSTSSSASFSAVPFGRKIFSHSCSAKIFRQQNDEEEWEKTRSRNTVRRRRNNSKLHLKFMCLGTHLLFRMATT